MKPDFDANSDWLLVGLEDNGLIDIHFGTLASDKVSMVLREIYAAGLERAAEIAEAYRDGNPTAHTSIEWTSGKIASAIRAEKDAPR